MDSGHSQPWSASDHIGQDQMMGEEMDFTSLLDLEDITLDNLMPDGTFHPPTLMQQHNQFAHPVAYMASIGDTAKQQAPMQVDHHSMFYYPQHAPPTPISHQLEGVAQAYHSHNDTAVHYEQDKNVFPMQQRAQQPWPNEGNDFTPLVSPAVTPAAMHLQSNNNAVSPAALPSPMTSPATPAQWSQQSRNGRMSMSATSTQRPTSLQRPASSHAVVSRPQKRKTELEAALQTNENTAPPDRSTTTSTSPEPRSDKSTMGPPPKPGRDYKSPRILAQIDTVVNGGLAPDAPAPSTPATPMSLMSLENTQVRGKNGQAGGQSEPTEPSSQAESSLNDLALPPAARTSRLGAPARVTTAAEVDDDPQSDRRKTPKLGPLDTASSKASRIPSTATSPHTNAGPVAASGSRSTTPRSGKLRGSSQSRKRGSSVVAPSVSPAILPRISPSIKPLLPAPSPSMSLKGDSNNALLSASTSKSNYQNLLQGTLLPGVSYPESLTSGLTSKRTSHKIAEQDRRTRINDALKQLQGLLPSPVIPAPSTRRPGTKSGPASRRPSLVREDTNASPGSAPASPLDAARDAPLERDGHKGASNEARIANSKAATVENAIEHILKLQREIASLKEQVRERDEEIQSLKSSGLN